MDFRKFLTSKQLELDHLQSEKSAVESDLNESNILVEDLTTARNVMNDVGVVTQEQIKTVIEDLCTRALQAVFGLEYSFIVEGIIIRNKPEMNFYVQIGDKKFSPKSDLGGGVIDILSFALRILIWTLKEPRTEPIMILDEPMKFVDKERLGDVGLMISEMSRMLDMQFIMVTHEDRLVDAADKAYRVYQRNAVSIVEEVQR